MLKLMKRLILGEESEEAGGRAGRIELAVAVLLLEAAHSDERLAEVEEHLVNDLLTGRFGLSAQDVDSLVALAGESRRKSAGLFRYTTEINEHFSQQEKGELLDELWRVVLADGIIDKYEEHLMRQVTALLRLSHNDMIDSKLRIKQELA